MKDLHESLTKKTEKVLEGYAEYEVNLGSETGRRWIAEKIVKTLMPELEAKIKSLTSEIRFLKNMGQI